MKISSTVIMVFLSISPTAGSGCSPAQQKTAETVAVKIAEDACKEIANEAGSPDWVTLACAAGAGVANVVMPKTEWQSIKARRVSSVDAGTAVLGK